VLHLPAYSLLRAPLSVATLAAAAQVRARGGIVSVDLASRAPLLAAGADNGLRAVRASEPDILFANVDEVAALVGRRGAARLLDVAPIVVVKLGPGGCIVLWRGPGARSVLEIEIATKPLAAADTTGAGDAFDAGFLYSLLSGGFVRESRVDATLLRRAALTGHRGAAKLLTSRRPEIDL
jgi:sugar/nucleoside kinase (ribokinase family)